MAYKNPRMLSDAALAAAVDEMGTAARQVMRQFQRKKSSIYSAEYEGLAARNRQEYGQGLLPKNPPADRAGMEEYYRRAQQALQLGSVSETRARIKEQKANLERTLGIKIQGKFDAKAQKTLSDFLHSDEWKKAYSFGSARAFEMLRDELASGLKLSEDKAAERLKEAFLDFAATGDLLVLDEYDLQPVSKSKRRKKRK